MMILNIDKKKMQNELDSHCGSRWWNGIRLQVLIIIIFFDKWGRGCRRQLCDMCRLLLGGGGDLLLPELSDSVPWASRTLFALQRSRLQIRS